MTTSQSPNVTVRRVIASDPGFGAEVSGPTPDGKAQTTLIGTTGDLGVRDLSTGQVRSLTRNPAPYTAGMALISRASRDGKLVAYAWLTMEAGEWDLRVVDMAGSEPRVVFKGASGSFVTPTDWSPDGGTIAAVITADASSQILLIPAVGGTPRVLRAFESHTIRTVQFSPDGRCAAYDRAATTISTDRAVYLADVATGSERELLLPSGDDRLMGWSPDGRHVVILRTRDGAPAAWMVPVANGRASGQPTLVKSDLWRSAPLASTPDGRFYYTVETGGRSVYIANIDPATGDIVGTPTALARSRTTEPSSNRIRWAALSRDGTQYAFARTGRQPGSYELAVVPTAEGTPRVIARGDEGLAFWSLAWAPDGQSLYVVRPDFTPPSDGRSMWRIPLGGGEGRRLSLDAEQIAQPRFDRSGRRLVYGAGLGGAELWVLENVFPARATGSGKRR